MGFLSPWFLAGIAAVALPLWLHLLRQYKRNPQLFPSLMFFERRVQSSTRHRRLRFLVLLALRMALLTLLALAFANPFVEQSSIVAGRRKLTVVVIDRSFSMRYRNHFEQAKAEGHKIVNGLPGRAIAQILALDARIENLTQPEMDHGVLNSAIDSLQPDDAVSSYGEFARAMRIMDQSTGMNLDVHLVSDMQNTSLPATFTDLQLGPHTTFAIHCLGDATSPNWAVESVIAPAHVYESGKARITATIASWQTSAATRRVSLILDGKTLATKDVAVPAAGRASVEFPSIDVPYGEHKGVIAIEPHDSLPNDDSFPFSTERSDPRRVLYLIASGRNRQAFYYKAALESTPDTGLTVQTSSIEQIEGADFSKFAYLVLNDIGRIGGTLENEIINYVQRGGGLLIAAGPTTTLAGKLPITADSVSESSGVQGATDFPNVQFTSSGRISPKPDDRIVSRFADGSPLLIERRLGEGKVLIFASTLDNSTNDFPLHTSFLPFVANYGRFLAGTEDVNPDVVAGTPIELRRTRNETTAADVIGPDGRHELDLTQATKALDFDLAREGFYQVQRADGRRLLMAVHADRRESDLTRIAGETLDLWRNTGDKAAETAARPGERQTVPYRFWRWFLLLCLAAALIESLFASRYLTGERQSA